ncbi:MAG TPA: hypothetical protein VM290_09545 [Gaiellaceae bacterium]|nr:hypothetical protein [Gaiellaceae bacterium]
MGEFLRIYLNDQLALGVAWREVAKRSARANRGTDVGAALERVAREIAEDVETFEQLMRRLGHPRNRVKTALAIAGERVGRLKLNGRVASYSPLSRFVELDFLVMGIEGKKILWANLRDLAGLGACFPDVDFDGLVARADRQRETLEPHRAAAGAVLRAQDTS